MKKGKKRKFADTQSSVNSEKKRNSGSGSGQTSYLHLKLEIGEGGREADLSPEYVENHLIMALKYGSSKFDQCLSCTHLKMLRLQ